MKAVSTTSGRVRVRLFIAFFLAVTSVLFAAPSAAATNDLMIRKIDTSDGQRVQLTVMNPQGGTQGAQVAVRENGKQITDFESTPIADSKKPVGIALVLDTTNDAGLGAAMDKEKIAAIKMVKEKQPNQKFAIVAFNSTARTVVNLTSDTDTLVQAIENLKSSGDSSLWNGISIAAGLFADGNYQANIVVVSTTEDGISQANSYSQAQSQLRSSKAALFGIALPQRNSANADQLGGLVNAAGGRMIKTNDADSLSEYMLGYQKAINEQLVVTYTSPGASAVNVEVSVGGVKGTAHAARGTVAEGSDVAPQLIAPSKGTSLIGSPIVMIGVSAVAFLAIGALLYGIIEIIANDKNQLSRALRPYSDEPEENKDVSKLADSELIKRAVASTAKIAERRGLLTHIGIRLEQADLPLKPAEAIFFTVVIALFAMVVGAIAFGFLGLAFSGLLFAYLPYAIVGLLGKLRRRKFTSQLPDTLQLLSGSLRAGYSLVQGLDAVSKQAEAPMGSELSRAMSEARLGRPVEEALDEVADRMG